jgi:DNA-binding beta-propeller fold protein YncE
MTRVNRRTLPFTALLLALLLAGCATPVKMTMHYGTEEDGVAQFQKVWPGEPDMPRYMYVGQLTGEANFKEDETAKQRDALTKALKWLVGLGRQKREPLVLRRPHGVAVDEGGRVYVTDMELKAVFVFDEAAGELEVWANIEAGRLFEAPVGITIGPEGDILVADAELGSVFRFSPEGKLIDTLGSGQLERPTGIAWDATWGHLYVADTRAHQVKVFDREGTLIRVIGTPGKEDGGLNSPTNVTLADGYVYVADTLNARVQVFTDEGKHVRQVGRRGLYLGNMTRPKGVAVDDEGNLYVIESYFDHLLIFNSEGRFLLPIGGAGAGVGQFYLPAGIWVDRRNRVYVADMFNGRIVVLQYLGG